MVILSDMITLLDRKYQFLLQSDQFMLDLVRFIEFLTTHPHLKYYTEIIVLHYQAERESCKLREEDETKTLINLSKQVREAHQELDDSTTVFRDPSAASSDEFHGYRNSFARFNDIISKNDRHTIIGATMDLNKDLSDARKLLDIIKYKIYKFEEPLPDGERRRTTEGIQLALIHAEELRTYNHKQWLNSCRSLAGKAFEEILAEIGRINPKPKNYETIEEHAFVTFEDDPLRVKADIILAATYKEAQHQSDTNDFVLQEHIQTLQHKIKRVYEAVREETGSSLLHRQLLSKYKTRCEWYNFNELQHLLEETVRPPDSPGKFKKFHSQKEDALSMPLARFLFDNGIPVMYRLKAGVSEMDLVDPDADRPLLIEVKVFEKNRDKSNVIHGFAQLYSYISKLSATMDIDECYYVIFRLSGSLLIVPEQIQVNHYTINTMVIDLGRSNESGSKQKKLIEIKGDEFIKAVEELEAAER